MGQKGTIYKGIGGFYYVKTTDGEMLECRARGILRKRGQKPLAGDAVVLGQEAGTYYIDEILPRKNALVRPPVANVDQLCIVASTAAPKPNFLAIDRMTVYALECGAVPVVVATKPDLAPVQPLQDALRHSGIAVVTAPVLGDEATPQGKGLEELAALLPGVFTVFCGNSGVGKSTLLNALQPEVAREVGEVSDKLGRGRHTTREVEILDMCGGRVADTPGFASFDTSAAAKDGAILADNLQLYFPEIKSRIGQCRFGGGCAHVGEAGCAVKQAVEEGRISPSRYHSYVTLYKEAKEAESRY